MKPTVAPLFGLALLLITAHRLPAPIQEVQETPTATVAATPTPMAALTATGAARYAGTWTGKINMEKLGDVDVTLIINGAGTTAEVVSRVGAGRHGLRSDGKKVWWQSGAKNKIDWTLTLNPDGQTAAATRTFDRVTTSATFQRVSAATAPNTTPGHAAKRRKHP
jgi:hypothetical protein